MRCLALHPSPACKINVLRGCVPANQAELDTFNIVTEFQCLCMLLILFFLILTMFPFLNFFTQFDQRSSILSFHHLSFKSHHKYAQLVYLIKMNIFSI